MIWIWLALGALLLPVGLAASGGARLPKAHSVTRRARFRQGAEPLWQALTDVDAFPSWRPDVQRVERVVDREGRMLWREHGSHGSITFERVEADPPRRLVTRVADPRQPFGGTWTTRLEPAGGDGTAVTITEDGEIYNPLFRFLARFVFGYSATVDAYLKALGKKFGEDVQPGPAL